MTTKKTKNLTLDQIEKNIKKAYGNDAMTTILELDHPRIPTGIIALDNILGGGFPKGRIVDLYGVPSGGKSGICYYFVAQAQKEGKCVFIDLENSYDAALAQRSGVDIDELLVVTLETAESVLELVEQLCLTGEVSAVIIDSWAGLVPAAELEGDIGDSHVDLLS